MSAMHCGLCGPDVKCPGHARLKHMIERMAKRGYSRDFKPHGDTGKRYLLDKIPAGLWRDVQTKAKREGISIRALILRLLTDWVGDQRPAGRG